MLRDFLGSTLPVLCFSYIYIEFLGCQQLIAFGVTASSFRPDLMELLSAWARGAKFADLLRQTDIFEVRPDTESALDIRTLL